MNNIKSLRETRQLSQQDLAERAHISVGQLSRIECGHNIPTRLTAESLARVLKVKVAELGLGE